MSTRRAKQHKDLVAREKEYHHQAGGAHWHQHPKIRWANLTDAIFAESPADLIFVEDNHDD